MPETASDVRAAFEQASERLKEQLRLHQPDAEYARHGIQDKTQRMLASVLYAIDSLASSWRLALVGETPMGSWERYAGTCHLARRCQTDAGSKGQPGCIIALEPYWAVELVDDRAAAEAGFKMTRARTPVNRFDRHAWLGPAADAVRYPCPACRSLSWLVTQETHSSDFDCNYFEETSFLLCLECLDVRQVSSRGFGMQGMSRWRSGHSFDDQIRNEADEVRRRHESRERFLRLAQKTAPKK